MTADSHSAGGTGRRPRLDPDTARIRTLVRRALAEHPADRAAPEVVDSPCLSSSQPGPGPGTASEAAAGSAPIAPADGSPEDPGPVLVAVSGGADSLALAAATAFLHSRGEGRFLAVTVDHGLQEGSAERAQSVRAQVESWGMPCRVVRVEVDGADPRGLEAAARRVRYAALAREAWAAGAGKGDARVGGARATGTRANGAGETVPVVLTGHTRDDQSETVLLGLLRGSGARSLSGMAPRTRLVTAAGPLDVLRPLLTVPRESTRASCRAQGLEVWDDPMNDDERFTRVRARTVLRALTDGLGQDVRGSLARTADLLREDADDLDARAGAAWEQLRGDAVPASLPIAALATLSLAVRSRVLRRWLLARGLPADSLTADHVRGVREAAGTSGAGRVSLPGGGAVHRDGDRLVHEPGDG